MATTQIEEKPRIITPRNTRRNEIIAILLLAFGLLLALCLVSAAFYPNDPSWNSAGQTETHNLAGITVRRGLAPFPHAHHACRLLEHDRSCHVGARSVSLVVHCEIASFV